MATPIEPTAATSEPNFRFRSLRLTYIKEWGVKSILIACSTLSVFVTLAIVVVLFTEATAFFHADDVYCDATVEVDGVYAEMRRVCWHFHQRDRGNGRRLPELRCLARNAGGSDVVCISDWNGMGTADWPGKRKKVWCVGVDFRHVAGERDCDGIGSSAGTDHGNLLE